MLNDRRIGQFVVPRKFINEIPEAVSKAMAAVIVLRAEPRFDTDCIHYEALCPHFAPADTHCYAPFYKLDLDAEGNLTVDKIGNDPGLPIGQCFDGEWRREQQRRHQQRLAREKEDLG